MGALTWLAALATIAGLYFGATILIPAAVSFFLLIVLEPLVSALERRHVPRTAGAACAVSLFILLTFGAIFFCGRAVTGVARNVPKYSEKLRSLALRFEISATSLQWGAARIAPRHEQKPEVQKVEIVHPPQETWGPLLWRGLGGALEAVGLAIFVPFLALFGLSSKLELLAACERVFAPYLDVERAGDEIPRMVRAFFLGNLIVGAIAAVIEWTGFAAIGLDNAAGIGIVSGFVNLIPIMGLPLALVLPLAQGLLQFDHPAPFALIVAIVLGLHLVISNFVIPRVIGARVKLNAAAATLGMLFWWWVWGAVGFLFAIPLTALIKIALECRPRTEPAAKLLAATPRERKPFFESLRRH